MTRLDLSLKTKYFPFLYAVFAYDYLSWREYKMTHLGEKLTTHDPYTLYLFYGA
jgi:hypothetical protein